MTTASPRLCIEQIRALTGETTFAKGMLLTKAGKVHLLAWQGDSVTARVAGSHDYQVRLQLDGDDIDSHCTCPAASYQTMCKHAVATALTLIAQREQAAEKSETQRLRDFFAQQEKEALITLLLEELGRDGRRWQSYNFV